MTRATGGCRETAHKRTHGVDIAKLAWLQQFLRGRPLVEITRKEIAGIGERKRAEASSATANRYLALVRAILRKAWLEWHWLDRVPKVKLYRDPKRRARWITPLQARVLLDELPAHQRDIILFALAAELRPTNVTQLGWQQVDLERGTCWVAGEEVKAGEGLHVSLNDVAQDVLRRRGGKHPMRVFIYKGRLIMQVNTKAWRKALQRAGIANFPWYDLRHSWARWLVQHGTPLNDMHEKGGWKSATTVRRYAYLAPAQLARYAAVIDGLLGTSVRGEIGRPRAEAVSP